MLSKTLVLPSLASFLIFNGFVNAEETISENPNEVFVESHVSVRSRDTDPEKRETTKDMRIKQYQNEEDNNSSYPIQRTQNFSDNAFMLAPRALMQPHFVRTSSYPVNAHWLVSIADNGSSVELEDGSHWEIPSSDTYVLRGWKREDTLVISPNYSWLSSYDYYITNKSSNSYVKANLYVGPLAHGPYSHWVVDIDYVGGHIYLENQMVWCVNPQESYLLKDWAINDHVIMGLNDSWFSSYSHILINVNLDQHLTAKQY